MFRQSPISILSFSILFLFAFQSGTAQVPSVTQPCANSAPDTASTAKQDCVESTKSIKRIKVEFEGLQAFKASDVLKALREDKVALAEDRMPTEAEIEQATGAIKKLLKRRGYYDASINPALINDSLIRFVVNEGTRFSIGVISFEGNRKLSSDELTAKLQEHLATFAESLKAGYDEEIFDYCHRLLMNSVRARGYLQAQYLEPRITASGTSLNITVPIEEGPIYRLGKLKIEGATAFSPLELKALCPVREGETASGEKLSDWLYTDLRDAYGEKGFIQYTAEIDPTFNRNPNDKEDGTVDILITIDEGKRFKVGSISFRGDQLSPEEMNSLNSLFLLRPGDFFNKGLFEESVKRLNGSGVFDGVDKDKDSTFVTDDEGASVAIVLNVKRKIKGQ